MKKYKFVSVFFTILVTLTLYMPRDAHAQGQPEVNAQAAILAEPGNNEVFFAKNEHLRMFPASTTKIMTVLLAIEAYERGDVQLSDMVEASEESQYDITWDGSTQNILPGEIMSLEDLLYCAMVASANEACNIIGEYIAGDIYVFLSLMNERARELGCLDTNYINTHGMPNGNHYTTAYDLYLITAEAVKHPLFMRICNTLSRTIPATNMSDARYITNTNSMIHSDSNKYYYKHAVGIKTGSTDSAGFCLVSSAEKDGIQLIGVVLNSEALPAEDGSYDIYSFIDSRRMYEWFFDNFSYKQVLSGSELLKQVQVALGEESDSVIVRPDSALKLILPKDIDAETAFTKKIVIYSELEGAEPLVAPVEKGDKLGEITLSYNGVDYGPIPLIANTGVSLSKLELMKKNVSSTLSKAWVKWCIAIVVFIFGSYIALIVRYNILLRRRRKMKKAKSMRQTLPTDNDRD